MKKPNAAMQQILDAHKEMGPLPIESLPPELARQIPLLDRAAVAVYGQHITKKALAPMPLPVGAVQHVLIPGPEGDLIARVYSPDGDRPHNGWPMMVYFHGGGWVIATLDTYDASCRALCKAAGAVVVSVQYRLAPEHPFPAARDDAVAAWQWVCANGARFGGDPSNVAIAGESAGGNLAALVALKARDDAMQAPVHQLLIYPVTDLQHGPDSPSALENENAAPLNRAMLAWFYDHYIPAGQDRGDPSLSPLHASLENLPPATIILAQIDPLRSEGEHYAAKLREAGNDVTLQIYEGVTHEFFGLQGLVGEAADALKLAAGNLKNAFENSLRRAA